MIVIVILEVVASSVIRNNHWPRHNDVDAHALARDSVRVGPEPLSGGYPRIGGAPKRGAGQGGSRTTRPRFLYYRSP